ncbi:MAG: NADH-quinone oxidoreductase subunit G, partial [Actinomycetota bacterium]|nr:NADH-quinone oxidoreductase subunit G [Actinomycetota bacterium]
AEARADLASIWGTDPLPAARGRDTTEILIAARDGELAGLLVGGVDPGDLPDPLLAEAALDNAGFVVSLELLPSAVTARADVVLPVAPMQEKAGTYVDWEGRLRSFDTTLRGTGALSDGRILDTIAADLGVDLGTAHVESVHVEWSRLGPIVTPRPKPPVVTAGRPGAARKGEAVLATWHWLLDEGTLQRGEPHLAGTAKRSRVLLSAATAADIGAAESDEVTVSTDRGSVTLPLVIADLPDRVVWLPTRSAGSAVRRALGADNGAIVRIAAAGKAGAE